MHTYVSTYVCVDSCSHFLLWLAFLFIVVDFVCLRRNCTKREKNFCTLRFGFALLRADLVYTLLLFCFVFVCILFSMLCFKVKCQRRRQHSLMLFLLLWGLVVSQYKKEQRKKATYKHIHLNQHNLYAGHRHTCTFVFWLRKLFHGHMYTHS